MLPGETERHGRFLRVFTAHEMAIRAYVRRLVPSRADADDVMQEVAVVLWEKFPTFRENSDFRAWAFGIARYEVLSWRRDKGRDRLVLDDDVLERLAEETAQEEPRLQLQRQALEGCLAKMNAGQRDLLMLAYEEGVSIQTVAQQSGRTVAGFYQWLHRVRRLLLECIQRGPMGRVWP
ncbi:sigma-70 family RNA polymerase sigma factor [Verrucomicrobium sp. BvORR106]|uniref:sigma-70 family RNA polymerase sigma factor n=1 Tax=Verrucomicrobium sp. BvORR106 TaxID=1403819 RepID=UPI0005711E4C|nr:sigma-70 family RNA polymerase sigma factor [Verrucomicrobium sp. BvORR106]